MGVIGGLFPHIVRCFDSVKHKQHVTVLCEQKAEFF